MTDVVGLVVLIVVIYLAFRIGAILMKVLLGLLALALIVWLVAGLFGASPPAGRGPRACSPDAASYRTRPSAHPALGGVEQQVGLFQQPSSLLEFTLRLGHGPLAIGRVHEAIEARPCGPDPLPEGHQEFA